MFLKRFLRILFEFVAFAAQAFRIVPERWQKMRAWDLGDRREAKISVGKLATGMSNNIGFIKKQCKYGNFPILNAWVISNDD